MRITRITASGNSCAQYRERRLCAGPLKLPRSKAEVERLMKAATRNRSGSPRQHYGPRGLSARPEGVRGSGPALGPSSERRNCMFKQGHTQHPMSAYDPKRTLISLLGGSFCHRCRHAAFDLVGFRVMASSLRYQTIGSYRVACLPRHLQKKVADSVKCRVAHMRTPTILSLFVMPGEVVATQLHDFGAVPVTPSRHP